MVYAIDIKKQMGGKPKHATLTIFAADDSGVFESYEMDENIIQLEKCITLFMRNGYTSSVARSHGISLAKVLRAVSANNERPEANSYYIGINVMNDEKQIIVEIPSTDGTCIVEFETTDNYRKGIRKAIYTAGYSYTDTEDDVKYFNNIQRALLL